MCYKSWKVELSREAIFSPQPVLKSDKKEFYREKVVIFSLHTVQVMHNLEEISTWVSVNLIINKLRIVGWVIKIASRVPILSPHTVNSDIL